MQERLGGSRASTLGPLHDGPEQLGLRREVGVDGTLRVAGCVGDRLQRGTEVALPIEDIHRGIEQALARLCPPFVPTESNRGRALRFHASMIPRGIHVPASIDILDSMVIPCGT